MGIQVVCPARLFWRVYPTTARAVISRGAFDAGGRCPAPEPADIAIRPRITRRACAATQAEKNEVAEESPHVAC